ncbi:hypothetical protein [Streptomyces sp. NPDC017520]|uniref:hypothetical protein n=1 Tax=Streptomyces sp. NPDC017520 TaxID=3364998 RepID=UPI0037972630
MTVPSALGRDYARSLTLRGPVGAYCLPEPASGSDAASPCTKADRLLVAEAQVHRLVLVTRNDWITPYDVPAVRV